MAIVVGQRRAPLPSSGSKARFNVHDNCPKSRSYRSQFADTDTADFCLRIINRPPSCVTFSVRCNLMETLYNYCLDMKSRKVCFGAHWRILLVFEPSYTLPSNSTPVNVGISLYNFLILSTFKAQEQISLRDMGWPSLKRKFFPEITLWPCRIAAIHAEAASS